MGGGFRLAHAGGEKPVDGGEDAVKAAFLEAEKAAHAAPHEAVDRCLSSARREVLIGILDAPQA